MMKAVSRDGEPRTHSFRKYDWETYCTRYRNVRVVVRWRYVFYTQAEASRRDGNAARIFAEAAITSGDAKARAKQF